MGNLLEMRRRRPPDPSTLSGILKSLVVRMDVEKIEVAVDDQGQFSAKKQ